MSFHLLIQYSVNMMSRIGKFAGGFNTAYSLIRTIALAYETFRDSTTKPCFFRISYTSSGRLDKPNSTNASNRVSGFPDRRCSRAAVMAIADPSVFDVAIPDQDIFQ